ncbi:hypothetical protein HN709_01865 [Candidatus Peregrinibacteria bacterium]|jgi:hypothetical protein|nr:hypothetical protein [Candidatus Peregrinibacteria bacterium]MBT7736410.1 hypothetical protein [Candidatus Peregrinibacteria bacterium]
MKKMNGIHPIVIFWIGVLTGAVLVSLVFGYKMMDAVDYQDRVIRATPSVAAPQAPDYVPVMKSYGIDRAAAVSIGLPPGGYIAIPDADAKSIGLPPGGKVR